MSVALDRGGSDTHTIQRSKFIQGGISCHRSPASGVVAVDRRIPVMKVEDRGEDTDSCSSSSIGRNSDLSSGSSSSDGSDDDSGEIEVQSSFKGPLDTMDVLQDVLPIRRGISKHYCGKSKSFTSLSDAVSSPSIKDLAKPINSHNKKRKNELASGKILNKSQNNPPRSNTGGVLKRLANANRSTSALGESESSIESKSNKDVCNSISLSPPSCLPPLHPQRKISPTNRSSSPPPRLNNLPWRSFSLSDLQCVAP